MHLLPLVDRFNHMCVSGCSPSLSLSLSLPLSLLLCLQLERLAKRLKKEKVSVDLVVFGEQEYNEPILCSFVDTINGKDGSK